MNTLSSFLLLNLLIQINIKADNVPGSEILTENYQIGDELARDLAWTLWSPLAEPNSGIPSLYQNRLPEHPVVQTSSGKVKGFASISSRKKTRYEAYLGIPYATPPLGNLRFKDPIEIEPWNEVLDGTHEKSPCISLLSRNKESEDCLFLNVYTPNKSPYETLKAVLVFIHGGGFIGGSSNTSLYSPDFIVDQDIVLVTLNYRLGPLGFLTLQNEKVPGNAGLKDQMLALKWIKKNVKFFGGDPNRITIQGESAGAASVSYHLLSPKSKDLFNGAILESGTFLAPWGYTPPDLAKDKAFKLGKIVGCVSLLPWMYTEDELLECLQKTSAKLLAKSQVEAITLEELFTFRIIAFVPTREPDVPGAFITQDPWEQLHSGVFNHVPTIIGSNSREGLLAYPALKKLDPLDKLVSLFGLDLTRFVPYYLRVSPISSMAPEIDKRIRDFYFEDDEVFLTRSTFVNIITDTEFLLPIQETARLLSQYSTQPVYNYRFSYDGPYGIYKQRTGMQDVPGVSHADELGYLFHQVFLYSAYTSEPAGSPAEITVSRLTKLWANFARTGNPTPTADELLPTTWKPFKVDDGYYYYDINSILFSRQEIQKSHIDFWTGIVDLVKKSRT